MIFSKSDGIQRLGKYRPVVIGIALFLLVDAIVLGLNFHMANELSASAESLAVVGRQRTLSQQITKGLLQLDNAVAIGADPQPVLAELQRAYRLFDGALAALDKGGLSSDSGDNPIYLEAVSSAEARYLVDRAVSLWSRYEEALKPIVSTARVFSNRNHVSSQGFTDEELLALQETVSDLYASIDFVSEYSLELLALMDGITAVLQREAESEIAWLRRTQVAGIVLVLVFFFVVLTHFIRDLHRSDEALRRSESKYRTVFETSVVGLFVMDRDGRFTSVNPALVSLLGFESQEALLDSERSQAADHRAQRVEFMAFLCGEADTVQNAEMEFTRKDGSVLFALVSFKKVLDANGRLIAFEGSISDHTERKLLQAQIVQSQKLESIGQLSAGIAHEINTPTQFVGDNIQFIKESFGAMQDVARSHVELLDALKSGKVTDELTARAAAVQEEADLEYLAEEIPDAIDQSLEGVGRIAGIVRAMKEFSHPGGADKETIDLNRAIQSTVTVASNEWKYVADLETDFDPALCQVSCFPQVINQAILNILVNAAHAIGDANQGQGDKRGKIRITTRQLADCVEVRIADSGGGIPESIRDSVFNPFFTTKEVGKGTGQGLSIAHSAIADKHGGSLIFETETGVGTTFIIRLPFDDPGADRDRTAA